MIATIAGKNFQQSLRSREKHFLAIVAITANHVETSIPYMETAPRSNSQRPLNLFGMDRYGHMETNLNGKVYGLV